MRTTNRNRADVDVADPGNAEIRSVFAFLLPATPTQRVVGVLALLFLAGCFGYFIGVRDRESDLPSAQSADAGFLYDMSAHHQQAVQLSMIELADGSIPSVQAFASEIVRSQSYEIGLMKMRLGNWGLDPDRNPQGVMAWMGMSLLTTDAMPGMADEQELQAFRRAEGADVDAMFLALMSDHHAGGVAMAQAAAASAADEWVVDTAGRMASIQASEIAEMGFAREAAGLDPQPPGFVSDFGLGRVTMEGMDVESSSDGE